MSSNDPQDPASAPPTGDDDTLAAVEAPTAEHDPGEALAKARLRSKLFDSPEEPVKVGRFSLLGRLGAGGMGVVYRGYDPQLRREVAVKLLHGNDGGDDTQGRQRLLREAQTMARLNHPNIVQVFEVGEHDKAVFVAMELIEGQTLGQWLNGQRSQRDIVSMFVEIGKGLAAAHEAGVVHRDFKPANVLLGDDGRPRVLDFGLAREHEAARNSDEDASFDDIPLGPSALTKTGAIVGTPAYMSPEQFEGARLDARTDQFSFCVALWEALHGERPFSGHSVAELATAVVTGKRTEPPAGRGVAGWLRAVCNRGLALKKEDRFESMDALLHELQRAGARRTRLVVASLLAVTVAAVFAVRSYEGWIRDRGLAACEADAQAEIESVWSPSIAAEVGASLAATPAPFAEQSSATTVSILERYATAWRDAWFDVCEAQKVSRTLAPERSDRSRWCLEQRRTELSLIVGESKDADAEVAAGAVDAAHSLTPVDRCRNFPQLPEVPPQDERPAFIATLTQLFRVRILVATNRAQRGLGTARQAHESALALDDPRLIAETEATLAGALYETGDRVEAERLFEDAYFHSVKANDLQAAAGAASSLAMLVGVDLGRPNEGLRWSRHARTRLEEAKVEERTLQWVVHYTTRGLVHRDGGRLREAREDLERAVALTEERLGPDHPRVAKALLNLGIVEQDAGNADAARQHYERALEITAQSLGSEHPAAGTIEHNIANLEYGQGRYDEALRRMERALEIREAALGPKHPNVAQSVINLAAFYATVGRDDEARKTYQRADTIVSGTFGPDHPNLAYVAEGLGALAMNRDDLQDAEKQFRRSLDLREEAYGPDHPEVAFSLTNLAIILAKTGRFDEARAATDRSLEIRTQALGAEHPYIANSIAARASVEKHAGQPAEARKQYEAAIALFDREDGLQQGELEAKFELAKLLDADGERERALTMAKEVERLHRQAGQDNASAQEVRQWLSEHRERSNL